LDLPQSAHWEHGPGAINPLPPAPGEFGFVAELEALRPQVRGAGNLQRFDYWLNTFRYMRAMAGVGGLRAELDAWFAPAYGLARDELRYILDPADVHGPDFPGETFRVLKEKETAKFGEYRTRRLVLEAWDKLTPSTAYA